METRPPKLIEAIVAKLLPPACRENVLGDLHERYTSTAHYILDALRAVPFVVTSQSRRNFRSDLLMGEAFTLQIGYAFEWQSDPYNGQILLPAWILIGLTLLALRILDAYAPPDSATQRQIHVKTGMAISFALAIAFVSTELGLGLIPERFLTLNHAVFNFFMISFLHTWYAKTTTPIAAGMAPFLKELRRLSQEKEGKAWGLNYAWLTAVLFVFMMNNSWEPATRSYLNWLMLGGVFDMRVPKDWPVRERQGRERPIPAFARRQDEWTSNVKRTHYPVCPICCISNCSSVV